MQKISDAEAPAVHRFMRQGPSWPDFLADGFLTNALPPQADAGRAQAWHQLWRTDESEQLPWSDISPADLAEIKMPDKDQFDALVATLRAPSSSLEACVARGL